MTDRLGILSLKICRFIPLSVVIITALSAASCSQSSKASAGSERDDRGAVPVAVVKVTRQELSRYQSLMAEFRPYQEVDVHAKVAGYLKKIYVDVGDRVKQGQLLGMLEVPELNAEVDQATAAESSSQLQIARAESEVKQAEAAHEDAHITYARLAEVPKIKPNMIAQQEIDQALARDHEAEAKVAAAQAAVAVAREKLREAKANGERVKTLLSYTKIEAPFAGIVTKRYADTGAMIPAGTSTSTQAMPVVRISEDATLRLVLPVPESIVPLIHAGAPVDVKVESLHRSFKGTVWRFTGKVDTATRTMETEIEVKNPQQTLKPGMYATANLTLDSIPSALAVPIQAVSVSDNKATVMLVTRDKTIEERAVTTGIETASFVEVQSGLNEDDLVVVGNRGQLKSGQNVEPRLTESENAH
ncbi:MAG TPA: efflux RND transporter periplasmic adaptor subunit [Blastocatellia bacterium]|nr:efflux RND transporter periplasmic adaptor subunit [Blastocatellia bacterium]